tara:strand:- start:130 stop:315 length:186 start_codon:yes stop_codon:yes gene_type:complete
MGKISAIIYRLGMLVIWASVAFGVITEWGGSGWQGFIMTVGFGFIAHIIFRKIVGPLKNLS